MKENENTPLNFLLGDRVSASESDRQNTQQNIKRIKVSDVVFREDLYPRIETSAQTVQKYAENLEVMPPIEVNQHNELIDGWHRWTAHKKTISKKLMLL